MCLHPLVLKLSMSEVIAINGVAFFIIIYSFLQQRNKNLSAQKRVCVCACAHVSVCVYVSQLRLKTEDFCFFNRLT